MSMVKEGVPAGIATEIRVGAIVEVGGPACLPKSARCGRCRHLSGKIAPHDGEETGRLVCGAWSRARCIWRRRGEDRQPSGCSRLVLILVFVYLASFGLRSPGLGGKAHGSGNQMQTQLGTTLALGLCTPFRRLFSRRRPRPISVFFPRRSF